MIGHNRILQWGSGGSENARWTPSRSPVVPCALIQEVDRDGLRLALGASGATSLRTAICAIPLRQQKAGFVALCVSNGQPGSELKHAIGGALVESASAIPGAVGPFEFLQDRDDVSWTFVGLWDAAWGLLRYWITGLEPAMVLNAGWRGRVGECGPSHPQPQGRRMYCGIHRFQEGERWLLYNKSLVDPHNPRAQMFHSVGIVQSVCDSRRMRNDLWVDYLLELGQQSHSGVLADGAVLLSLVYQDSAKAA